MKHTKHIHLLLASVLVASVALAQTRDRQAANSILAEDAISAARSQYTQPADISPDAKDGKTLAQFSQRGPGMPFPSQRGYPRGSYQTPWMDHGDAGHVLIGAAIGFSLGAALGATGSARNGTPVGSGVVIGGSIFGLIGAAIGAAHRGPYPFARRRRFYPSPWPEDDAESDLRSQSKPVKDQPQRSASARPVSPAPAAAVEAKALPSPAMPAVP